MTFFVDANIVVYSATASERAEPCLEILRAVARGEVDGRTSTAALEEVWYVEWRGRAGPLAGLTERAHAALTPLLPVTDGTFRLALAFEVPEVGPNDRLHAATCLEHGIEVIVTADAHFDGFSGLRRVDPLDREGVAELLRY